MTDLAREYIRTWLRDAHAMEEQAEHLFGGQAQWLNDYPDVCERLAMETVSAKERQTLLSVRLQQLGSASSILKDAGYRFTAGIQNINGTSEKDGPVKSMLALHTFTQMAIGSYQILIAAVLKIDDPETFKICKILLAQSQARALWIEDQLAAITQMLITRTD